jgi:DNA-binding beta-propeller fold protein YncE
MYILGTGLVVYQYDLLSAWNLNTANYTSKSADVSGFGTITADLAFSSDGTKMYVFMSSGNDTVYQYDLLTPWDVSTAGGSPALNSYDMSAVISNGVGGTFSTDGTKMYVTDLTTQTVYQFDLSTAWDVTTAGGSPVAYSKDVSSEDTSPEIVRFRPDGSDMYVLGKNTNNIYQYSLTTPWDISTASYINKSANVSEKEIFYQTFDFKQDGRSFFIVGTIYDTVFEYIIRR